MDTNYKDDKDVKTKDIKVINLYELLHNEYSQRGFTGYVFHKKVKLTKTQTEIITSKIFKIYLKRLENALLSGKTVSFGSFELKLNKKYNPTANKPQRNNFEYYIVAIPKHNPKIPHRQKVKYKVVMSEKLKDKFQKYLDLGYYKNV